MSSVGLELEQQLDKDKLHGAEARIAELEAQQAALVKALKYIAKNYIGTARCVAQQALADVKPAVCETCNGHGMIGGFINAANGYDAEPCPDCTTVKTAARKTCAAGGFMFGNDDACWFYCVGGGCGSDEPCEHQQPAGQEGSE